MSGVVWSKFFWSDWESDPKLKLCSAGAQGLWMRMLCVCAQAEKPGYLLIEGQPIGPAEMATLCGWPADDVERWWSELSRWGVFSTDRKGRVFSRRMVLDQKRAKNARENGKKGGNPKLGKQSGKTPPDNPPSKGRDKPHKPYAKSQKIERVPRPSLSSAQRERPPRDETARAPAASQPPRLRLVAPMSAAEVAEREALFDTLTAKEA